MTLANTVFCSKTFRDYNYNNNSNQNNNQNNDDHDRITSFVYLRGFVPQYFMTPDECLISWALSGVAGDLNPGRIINGVHAESVGTTGFWVAPPPPSPDAKVYLHVTSIIMCFNWVTPRNPWKLAMQSFKNSMVQRCWLHNVSPPAPQAV